jgi:hypothetical protein
LNGLIQDAKSISHFSAFAVPSYLGRFVGRLRRCEAFALVSVSFSSGFRL